MRQGRRQMAKAAVAVALAAALSLFAVTPAGAQFGWFGGGWGASRPAPPKPPPPPKPPEIPHLPPPINDDKPYDTQLFRLAEILGTLHYLRELCGANEGMVWRDHMRELASSEGTSSLRRARLVESFNRGYRDYSRTYRTCTQPALVAIQKFMDQAGNISDGLVANDK
jgi:uncharacterized protein (TIGR02301 family)